MTQEGVESLIFGKLLYEDDISHLNQTDNNTVVITPKQNTAGKTELKIGVLLPFTQKHDNLTAKIVWSGSSAIRMAVNEINLKETIPGAYITLIEKDSFPDSSVDQMAITNAVYASVTLLQQGVIGVIGDISSSWTSLSALMTSTLEIPQCSFTANAVGFSDKSQYQYFFRTIPTQVIIADVMLSFISNQGWKRMGILYTDDPLGQQFYQRALVQASQMDMHVVQSQVIPTGMTEDITTLLKNITNGARIIMVAATGTNQLEILKGVQELSIQHEDYVWLMMNDNSNRIKLNQTYDGFFFFDDWLSLNGYPPFETFLDQWASLDPNVYPYAGYRNISYYEGLAYSCMMVMAEGFGKMIKNSLNQTDELFKLANGELGEEMIPSAFNIGYVGPEGPMIYDSNGDLTTGNYLIYNLYNGEKRIVGKSTRGELNITNLPIFYDGTTNPPLDSPPSIVLNPNIHSAISHIILVLSTGGILFSIFCFFVVLFNRKNEIFKASSPLFCCLELIGFILTYVSVMMMIGIPSNISCIVTPITFSLGFILVLGNMIAKNYRIYRIFNNIFITRNVITDKHLIKTVAGLILIELIILIVGLITTQPIPTQFEVSISSHYWSCEPKTNSKLVFLILNAIYAACLLLFATFLAYKTRFAGKQYSRYSECKQMGLSVYNILFSALVGFAVVVNPLADFYTKYYINVISILWATTFSLFILFLPKLQSFYRFKKQESLEVQKGRKTIFSFLKSNPEQVKNEFLSLEQILASDEPILEDEPTKPRKQSAVSTTVTEAGQGNFIEVHEGEMPIRKVFRYFPFLSQWEMNHIMVFPWLGYFSHFSKDEKKGTVMSYSKVTIESNELEESVLKIHGQGWYDMYIQLPTPESLVAWEKCFKQKKPDYLEFTKRKNVDPLDSLNVIHPHDQIRFESSISQDCLLNN